MPETNINNLDNLTVNKVTKTAKKKTAKPRTLKTNLNVKSGKTNLAKASGQKTKSGIYRRLALTFIILTILLVALISYLSLVKVSIVLIPQQEKISDNLTIDVYDDSQSAGATGPVVIGAVKQLAVEQNKIFAATGKEVLGEEVTGKVTIINNYNKNQPLVATTRLLSADGKLFRLKNTVNVPAGGQLEAEVYADEAKQEMAIGPTTFSLPGLWAGLQDKIYGESKAAMQYNQKVKKTITQNDIDLAIKELKESFVARAKEEIGSAYKDYRQVLYQIDNNSLAQEVAGKVGEEKENFNLNMKTKVLVVAFSDEQIIEQAKQKLSQGLADDKELIELNAKEISYSLNNINLDQGLAQVNVAFSGKTVIKNNAKIFEKDKILGLSNDQLKKFLDQLPEIAGYEIKYFPSFIQKVPNLIDRIEIKIKK